MGGEVEGGRGGGVSDGGIMVWEGRWREGGEVE